MKAIFILISLMFASGANANIKTNSANGRLVATIKTACSFEFKNIESGEHHFLLKEDIKNALSWLIAMNSTFDDAGLIEAASNLSAKSGIEIPSKVEAKGKEVLEKCYLSVKPILNAD